MGRIAGTATLLLLCVAATEAMFSAKGDVEQLDGKTLPKFLNTHKPVMLLLYAPWCGHCKAIHPEWEKLATSLKGIVKVGAVDASQEKDVGQTYGVQGFPTIKMYGMNTPANRGKGRKPLDYQQKREFAAMKAGALGLIDGGYVQSLPATYDDAVKATPHVVLFTKKDKTPPIFSVVAASPKLKHLAFYKVQEGKKAASNFDSVPSWPSIAVFNPNEEPRWLPLSEGKAKYDTVAKFILGSESADAAESTEAKAPEKKKGPSVTSGSFELSSATLGRCQKGVLCVFHNGPREKVLSLNEKKVVFFTVLGDSIEKLAAALTMDLPSGSTLIIRPTNPEGTAAKYILSSNDVGELVGAAVNGDVQWKKLDLSETPLSKLLG
ncbi:hypothetical protein DIPPA_14108 [Diplonema papillatum]|nr:hypothetical protein DIPPA_14108 [Diplonema papillatum]|eukprot:gene20443-31469_t